MARTLLLIALLVPLSLSAQPGGDGFLQGPERVGDVRRVSGTVVGVHPDADRLCYVLVVDRALSGPAVGLGGGGRAFVCGHGLGLRLGDHWNGSVRQTGTRLARVGYRWRALPLFERTF